MGGEITPRKNAMTAAKILKVLAVLFVGAGGDCFSSFANFNSLAFVTVSFFFFGGMVAGWCAAAGGGLPTFNFNFDFLFTLLNLQPSGSV